MSAFPETLHPVLKVDLEKLGDHTEIRSADLLGGGCINHAIRLETEKNRYLLKWNADPLPGMFLCEARSLEILAATDTVRVPIPLAASEAKNHHPAYILLEWLEGSSQQDFNRLGEQVATLHRTGLSPHNPPAYGLDGNNYLGSTVQVNHWQTDWVTFFAESRLCPQMNLAIKNNRLPNQRRSKLERLIDMLPGLLGKIDRHPSLIHGDLWSGNVIQGPDGLALIDPAVSYSDREAEIAYTELFGGFTRQFYSAYNAAYPLDPGYPKRRDLYNLYHLLNHLNLFGEGYGFQVDAVLRRYVG